jgi:HAD superfamily hydrolase (TIGR01544 family)
MLDFAELLPFTQKVESIKTAGSKNFEIISDFDGTLTTGKLPDGSKISTFGLFRCFYENPKYRDEAQALFDHYYPLEVDENIEIETKNLHMEKWWIQHLSLIISLGITKSHIMDFAVQQETFVRHGFGRFDHIVDFYDGLGDIVKTTLDHKFCDYKISFTCDYEISSNFFQFNEAGVAVDYHLPIIHSHNKTSRMMEGLHSTQRPNKRNNCMVLGDSPADANMVNDTDFETVLRIGFCSNEKLLPQFQSVYDIVLSNENSLDVITDLIEHII